MNRWENIVVELHRLYLAEDRARQIVHRHLRAVPAKEMGYEAVLKETRQRCEEYDPEITASVRAWRWGGSLDALPADAQLWRYLRLNTALQWLTLAVGVPGFEKVLMPPDLADEQVIRWFLTDWWTIGGVQFRAMYEMGS